MDSKGRFRSQPGIIDRIVKKLSRSNTRDWQKWFAWRPVRVDGERVWLKTIYRRQRNWYMNYKDWARYEYGTIFNVIKTAERIVVSDEDTPRAG